VIHARFLSLAILASLLLAGLGPSCVVAFFVFQCDSDLDCTTDEFCDVNRTCVSTRFLNETDTCQVEHDCDPNPALGTENPEPALVGPS